MDDWRGCTVEYIGKNQEVFYRGQKVVVAEDTGNSIRLRGISQPGVLWPKKDFKLHEHRLSLERVVISLNKPRRRIRRSSRWTMEDEEKWRVLEKVLSYRSQATLANEVGVHFTVVNKWFKRRIRIPAKHFEVLKVLLFADYREKVLHFLYKEYTPTADNSKPTEF